MQIERTIMGVRTLGPGNRMAIWVNGCRRNCPGCVSPSLKAFNIRNDVNIERYFAAFDFSEVDGVTISGGEPFEQSRELDSLVTYLNEKGIEDILVYTGYTLEELRAKRSFCIDNVLSSIAVLIDGPYIIEQDRGMGNLKGSDNQKVHFLREKYREVYENYQKSQREMQVFPMGASVVAVGIPDAGFITEFKKKG